MVTPEENAFMTAWLGELPPDFEWPKWSVELTQEKLRECLSAACHVARVKGAKAVITMSGGWPITIAAGDSAIERLAASFVEFSE